MYVIWKDDYSIGLTVLFFEHLLNIIFSYLLNYKNCTKLSKTTSKCIDASFQTL